jgi:hypothetical protein
VSGLAPVTFSAIAVESQRRCGYERQLALGVAMQAQLTALDCIDAGGRSFQFFTLSPPAGDLTVTLRSTDFDTRLELIGGDGTPIAENDITEVSPRSSVINGIFDGRPMTVVVSSTKAGAGGAFTISSDRGTSGAACRTMFTTKGIAVERTVGTTTCGTTTPTPVDRFRIFLRASESLTVAMEDRTYSLWLAEVFDGAGRVVAQSRPTANYVETLTFTATVGGYYSFNVTCDDTNGQYRLTIR